MPQSPSNEETALIAVMGVTGSGKTSFINRASGSTLEVGHGMASCTEDVQESLEFILDGKTVKLIDTPGFDATYLGRVDAVRRICEYLEAEYTQGRKLNGVVFLHRITDTKTGGTARLSFKDVRNMCGKDADARVLSIVTTMWDAIPCGLPDEERARLKIIHEKREDDLRTDDSGFKKDIELGARMYRYDNTVDSAHQILRQVLTFPSRPIRVQQEMVDEGRQLPETDVGRGLRDEIANYVAELAKQNQIYREALAELHDDEEGQRELAGERLARELEGLNRLNARWNARPAETRAPIIQDVRGTIYGRFRFVRVAMSRAWGFFMRRR